MTEEEQAELRAVVTSVVGAAFTAMQKQLGEQLLELQTDVSLALDELDGIEIDGKDARVRLEQMNGRLISIELDVKDTRVQVAKLSREFIKDRRRDETMVKRVDELERRLKVREGR